MLPVLLQSSESSDLSDGPITVQEFMEVKSALTASEAKIQQLLKVNCHLSEELRLMQSKVSEFTSNCQAKWISTVDWLNFFICR